ncbi:hypothetical protein [Halobacillus seohaensis]|uniref:Lipoprotein n=1 Tax=Halobacillus seohaensis TaxID=447421 RepID=A0ABW2EN30_9BACI
MNSFYIYLSLLSVVLLSACSFIKADATDPSSEASASKEKSYEVMNKKETEKLTEYEISIDYPQTPNDQINQSIIDYVNQMKDSFKKISYEANSNEKHNLNTNYNVLYEDEHIFVVKFTGKIDTGDDSPKEIQEVLNFDKSKGKRLNLEHIFSEDNDYLLKLTKLANKEANGFDNLTVNSKSLRNLALKGDRVEIHLTKEEQENLQFDSDRIKISKADLEGMISSRYTEVHNSWVEEK